MLQHYLGFGPTQGRTRRGRTRVPRTTPGTQPSRVVHETRAPVPGSSSRDPPAHAVDRTTRATVRRRPSRGAFAAHRRQSPAPESPGRRREAESPHDPGASCPRPLSAAPRASRALAPRFPRREPGSEPRRRFVRQSWWARLFRGGPALMGFYPSSKRLAGSR